MKVANTSIKNLAKFVYLVPTLTNQNCILEEIKTILTGECMLPFSVELFEFPLTYS